MNINYELARKLKDAGFRQGVGVDTQCWTKNGWRLALEIGQIDLKSVLIRPTLSELIETCGEDLNHIKRLPVGDKVYWWTVTHSKFDSNGNNFEEQAETPEEAIANLYLKLNEE